MKNFFTLHKDKFLLGIILVLFAGTCFFLLYRLGVHPFIDYDESIYAQVAKEALQNHHWLHFTYFGSSWFEKPPLGIWLISISFWIGGINEWTARIPSALAAILTVGLSLRWVYELRKSYSATILTAICFFIMFPFITTAYFVQIDSIVGFFVLLALYAWWKKWYMVWGIAIGLGVLTKNIVGFFPIAPIIIYQAIEKDFTFLKLKQFWQAILAGAILILPWHIYQSFAYGKEFWNNYFFYHVLKRYSSSLENNGAPFWYFFQLVFLRYGLAFLVFAGSLFAGLILSWKDKMVRYLVISAVVIFLIFSSSTTKLPAYIVVVLPLFVMISGIMLDKLLQFLPKPWLRTVVITVLAVVFFYTAWQFNVYKLAQGEDSEEYLANKKVGLFLKDFHPELPVYINGDYKSLGIGFYASREIQPTTDEAITKAPAQRVVHTNF
jgi:4-amino-4-deoxy-L-arabinose transferase-like glycosyltransferase